MKKCTFLYFEVNYMLFVRFGFVIKYVVCVVNFYENRSVVTM